jgi:hypothetical protein
MTDKYLYRRNESVYRDCDVKPAANFHYRNGNMTSDVVIIPLQRVTHIQTLHYSCVLFQYTSWNLKDDKQSLATITDYDTTAYSVRYKR